MSDRESEEMKSDRLTDEYLSSPERFKDQKERVVDQKGHEPSEATMIREGEKPVFEEEIE